MHDVCIGVDFDNSARGIGTMASHVVMYIFGWINFLGRYVQ
jgi:hypothetical protein